MSDFDELFRLAVDTAAGLFTSQGVEPAPGLTVEQFVLTVTGCQHDGRDIGPGVCPMPGAARSIPPETTERTEPLVAAMRSGLGELNWFRSDLVPADFVTRSCAAELVGPDGAYRNDAIRFGLFLIGPGTTYERHQHAAHENYLVVAGSGEWAVGDAWSTHQAGEVIAVPSLTPHALRTDKTGLLMLYTWAGDITYETYRVG